ncbi:MAG: FtsQ-type POTRA domain-containing protein [Oscillospiraceae bacterium]|nr:FtsQ-type POTRA domain-containing protein [Oscillospiraceae bacterium]
MDTQQKKRPIAPRSPRTAKRPAPKQAVKQETKRPAPQQRRRSNTRNRRTTGPSRRELESKLLRQNANVRTNRRRVSSPKRYTQPVVYTQPKVFNRNRLLLQLLIICASVLAMVMALSVFFKVEVIKVSGAKAYSEWDVREASGIEIGDNLLTFSEPRASGQIQAKLPYVNEVRIGIKLPDTVIIYIEELEVAYAAKCSNGIWWLITSEGRVVEQIDDVRAESYTKIEGIMLDNPVVNESAVALEDSPQGVDPSQSTEETQVVTVTNAQRLSAALTILQALENNGIVGEAASVNVTNLNAIVLWYGTRFQVNLGDISNVDVKIAWMNTAIGQLSEYDRGILDVSFTSWEDEVGFTPFVG